MGREVAEKERERELHRKIERERERYKVRERKVERLMRTNGSAEQGGGRLL